MVTFKIPGRLPSLNQSYRVGRYRYKRSHDRQNQKRTIAGYIWDAQVPKFTRPIHVAIRWVEKDARRDYDNISAGAKVILDSLVATEKIPNDSRKWVDPVSHEFAVDKENPRIEVTINEIGNESGRLA